MEQSFATKENHRGTETRRNIDMRLKTEESSGLLYLLLPFFLRFQSPLCLRVSVVRFYNFLDKNKMKNRIT